MTTSLVSVCILLAGVAVAVIFSGLFFGKMIIDWYKEKSVNENKEVVEAEKKKPAKAKKEEVEEIDLDAMLATLEARAKETEAADKKEAEEEKATEKKDEAVKPVVIVVNNKTEQPATEDELDYEARLKKAKEAFEKLEKDYSKNTKALNKYRRTEKKKARNEKLLNKKAAELASLNLSVYNVKELADVDPEKKAKQEELTTHVAELKAAIMEADDYLTKNREKHNQEVKLNAYLEKEHARYEEEIKSLEEFLAKKDGE